MESIRVHAWVLYSDGTFAKKGEKQSIVLSRGNEGPSEAANLRIR